MKSALVPLCIILLAAPAVYGQPRRITDLSQAWIPEFRVEANLTASRIDNDEFEGELGNRFSLKEAGVGLRSYVDPFFRFDFVFSGEEQAGENGIEFTFGVEQAMVTWIAAPWGAEVRLGKMQTSVGEYNDDDPDEHPQVTAPDVILNYFGEDDGYIDTGINANIYVPNPWDLSQIFWLGVFNGDNPVAFHGGKERRPVYFTRYESFWELGALTGTELGLSYLAGSNSRTSVVGAESFAVKGETRMLNIHWEFDYRDPKRYLYSGFSLLVEYYLQNRSYDKNSRLTTAASELKIPLETETDESTSGFYLLAEYKLGRNWGVGGRLDSSPVLLVDFEDSGTDEESDGDAQRAGVYTIYGNKNQTASSFVVSYYPSRFSTLRFQYTNRHIDDVTVNEFWLQLQVLIGFERPDVF